MDAPGPGIGIKATPRPPNYAQELQLGTGPFANPKVLAVRRRLARQDARARCICASAAHRRVVDSGGLVLRARCIVCADRERTHVGAGPFALRTRVALCRCVLPSGPPDGEKGAHSAS